MIKKLSVFIMVFLVGASFASTHEQVGGQVTQAPRIGVGSNQKTEELIKKIRPDNVLTVLNQKKHKLGKLHRKLTDSTQQDLAGMVIKEIDAQDLRRRLYLINEVARETGRENEEYTNELSKLLVPLELELSERPDLKGDIDFVLSLDKEKLSAYRSGEGNKELYFAVWGKKNGERVNKLILWVPNFLEKYGNDHVFNESDDSGSDYEPIS